MAKNEKCVFPGCHALLFVHFLFRIPECTSHLLPLTLAGVISLNLNVSSPLQFLLVSLTLNTMPAVPLKSSHWCCFHWIVLWVFPPISSYWEYFLSFVSLCLSSQVLIHKDLHGAGKATAKRCFFTFMWLRLSNRIIDLGMPNRLETYQSET